MVMMGGPHEWGSDRYFELCTCRLYTAGRQVYSTIAVWSLQNFDMCGERVDRSRESKGKTHTVKVNAIVNRMWLDGTGLKATL